MPRQPIIPLRLAAVWLAVAVLLVRALWPLPPAESAGRVALAAYEAGFLCSEHGSGQAPGEADKGSDCSVCTLACQPMSAAPALAFAQPLQRPAATVLWLGKPDRPPSHDPDLFRARAPPIAV